MVFMLQSKKILKLTPTLTLTVTLNHSHSNRKFMFCGVICEIKMKLGVPGQRGRGSSSSKLDPQRPCMQPRRVCSLQAVSTAAVDLAIPFSESPSRKIHRVQISAL